MRRVAAPRKQIVSGAHRLSYLEAGIGRPMVLLHAFPLSADMWSPQLAVAWRGWRVIAPDLRGFAPDELPAAADDRDSARSLDDYADDVVTLMDSLGIPDAVVGGLSMGGYIAFALLRRAPGRLSGLILADTRSGSDSEEGRAGRRKMQALADREGPAGIAREMLPKLLSEGTHRARPSIVSHVREMIENASTGGIRAALECMMWRPDATEILRSVRVPTVIIVGAEDTLTPVHESERMHELLPASRLVVIPLAGHLSNLEQPDAFNRAIAAFTADA